MARLLYGASGMSQVVSLTGVPTVATATVYNARTGGVAVTDILNTSNAPLGGTVTPNSFGYIVFQGPDNYTDTLWLDFGTGIRWAVTPADTEALITKVRADLALAEKTAPTGSTARAGLPYTANTIGHDQMLALDSKITPRVASQAARDAAFVTPADGDHVFRTDTHAHETYNSARARWVADTSLIADVVLANSTTNAIAFNSIPQTYKHLLLIWHGRGTGTDAGHNIFCPVRLRLNADTTGNYSACGRATRFKNVSPSTRTFEVAEDGTGGAASSTAATYLHLANVVLTAASSAWLGYIPGSAAEANSWGGGSCILPGYTSTGYKTFQGESGFHTGLAATSYGCDTRTSGSRAVTAATTSITVFTNSGFWTSGSIISLYGVG